MATTLIVWPRATCFKLPQYDFSAARGNALVASESSGKSNATHPIRFAVFTTDLLTHEPQRQRAPARSCWLGPGSQKLLVYPFTGMVTDLASLNDS